ncbi:hypothetical protein [Saccharothrix sp. HUAS TT1]|uniref:hypothetical protein n=1 Tax=unclassified Saccharothrix TaxID=2593673 RepID=UPI00345B9888
MTAILFALAVVALIGYGLERNHRRQLRLDPGLSGSANADDRDLPRVTADLHATATRANSRPATATPAPANPAPTTHRPTTRRPTAQVRSVHAA